MMNEFVEFVHQMFPHISPYTKDKVREAIKQFDLSGKKLGHFLQSPLDALSQGDIVDSLKFTWFNKNGEMKILKTQGILLSNTCDAQRDKFLLFAPFIKLTEADGQIKSQIVKNQVTNLLYFPEKNDFEYAIDFNMTQFFNREMFLKSMEKELTRRIASLSQFGYYLFLCKLTIHLMRPEDTEIQDNRKIAI